MLDLALPTVPVLPAPTTPSPREETPPARPAVLSAWPATTRPGPALSATLGSLLTTSPAPPVPTTPSPTAAPPAPAATRLASPAATPPVIALTVPLGHRSTESLARFVSTELSPPEEMSHVRPVTKTAALAATLMESALLAMAASDSRTAPAPNVSLGPSQKGQECAQTAVQAA